MIAHILRKDLKLLWKPALAVSVPYLLATIFFVWRYDRTISDAVSISLYVAAFYLLIGVVQQDPIPGDRADWLTRPIPRWQLLSAKLLFALVTIVGPMLLVDIAVALATGFSFTEVLKAALGHGITVLFGLVLPVMALAAVTRSMAQCLIAVALASMVFALSFQDAPWYYFRADGLKWLEEAALLLIGFLAACAILTLQYRSRMTRTSVAIGLAACVGVGLNAHVPWGKAWSLQARLSAAGDDELQARFDSTREPLTLPSSAQIKPLHKIYLPMRFSGWRKDHHSLGNAALRLRLADGRVLESTTDRRELASNEAPFIPFEFAGAPLPTGKVAAEVTLHLLSTRPLDATTIPVNGQTQHVRHAGRCRATPLRSMMNVQCSQVGDPSTYINIYDGGFSRGRLEMTQNPLAPFFLRWSPSVFTRGATNLNTFAPSSPASTEPAPPPPFVELRPVRIEGVLERKIEIPNLRLQDWVLR